MVGFGFIQPSRSGNLGLDVLISGMVQSSYGAIIIDDAKNNEEEAVCGLNGNDSPLLRLTAYASTRIRILKTSSFAGLKKGKVSRSGLHTEAPGGFKITILNVRQITDLRASRRAKNKFQSGEILTLNKSSTIQHTVLGQRFLNSSLRDRFISVGRNISGYLLRGLSVVYFWLGEGMSLASPSII